MLDNPMDMGGISGLESMGKDVLFKVGTENINNIRDNIGLVFISEDVCKIKFILIDLVEEFLCNVVGRMFIKGKMDVLDGGEVMDSHGECG